MQKHLILSIPPVGVFPDFSDTEPAFGSARFTNRELRIRKWFFEVINRPRIVQFGANALELLNKYSLLKKWMITPLFKTFCGGETINACRKAIKHLTKFNVKSILDYSVEGGGVDAEDYDKIEKEILDSIRYAQKDSAVILAVFKITAFEDSIFLEDLSAKFRSNTTVIGKDIERWEKLISRVVRICQTAYDNDVIVMIDAEESWIQYVIDIIADSMMQKFNKERVIVMNTYQTYLKSGLDKLKVAHLEGRKKGYKIGAKVVRGAYMEKERERAKKYGYVSPIHPTKSDTDNCYDATIAYCLNNKEDIFLFAGTHNENSIYKAMNIMDSSSIKRNCDSVVFGQLYGMGDNISFNLGKHGYNVCKYLPYGKAQDCFPYLVRRAYENTSSQGIASRELQLIRKELERRNLFT